jgi:TonB family protein
VSALMRLSLVSSHSIDSSSESEFVLVHARAMPICLDEAPLSSGPSITHQVGNGITAPVVKRKVEPQFPEAARHQMGRGTFVLVVVQATIAREGCVRNVRLVVQSPYGDLNGAALMALAQWLFEPGRMGGVPVDVLFNLTINFRVP